MNKYAQHFLTICRHKYYVAKCLLEYNLYWQALVHDLSKFSPTEFISSAKYFCGTKPPIEKEKEERGYSVAWLHHKGCNKHHWQYWVDWDKDGKIITTEIPEKYLIEMAADLVGASKAYLKGRYDRNEPLKYFNSNKGKWIISQQDISIVEHYIIRMV
jgi:hypothetical protein